RREDPIGPEAAALDADGADAQRGRQGRMLRAGGPSGAQLNESIAGTEALDDGLGERRRPAAGAHDPVPVAIRGRELMEEGIAAEAAVQDDDRVFGERGPHLARRALKDVAAF